jgi:glucose-1-phosphate cytidylyltransferase
MTGGRLKRAQKYLDEDCFMVTYGDGVSDIDIARLLEFHKSHGKLATVTTFRPISRFGILNIDNSNQVLSFIEKPRSDAWASAGFFVFQRGVFDYLDGDHYATNLIRSESVTHDGYGVPPETFSTRSGCGWKAG